MLAPRQMQGPPPIRSRNRLSKANSLPQEHRVRRLVFLLIAAGASGLVARPATAQKSFEGVIDYDVSIAGMSMQIKQTVKGSQVRQEMLGLPMGTMISLTDAETMAITNVMPAQKMYMRIDSQAMMEQMSKGTSQPGPDDFKATGKHETIAGQECEHYAYAAEGMNFDMCIASGLGFMPFAHPGGIGGRGGSPGLGSSDMSAWRARFESGFVPLAMEMTSEAGDMTMRATAIVQKAVSDDLFKIPDGFTEMQIPRGPGR
jgi:hypothetical protein